MDDWESFAPYLDRIVEARLRMAAARDASRDPYDVWLDEYEPGCDAAFYDRFFSQVKDCVVPLLADCMASRTKPGRACVQGHFDEGRQWELARDLVALEGVDEKALWLGRTEHPFTGGPSTGFVLIASHAYEDDVLSNVFSMLHEGGHALYEQGVDPAYRFTSLRGGTSMGMHEAQSRFFENLVGRSEAFAPVLLDALARRFPGRLSRVTPRQLYLAENCAEPGLVRTEADELTYPLHILVRYEIERALFSPARPMRPTSRASGPRSTARTWASRSPITRAGRCRTPTGAGGDFGYFPTYALGSAYGAQLKHAMVADGVDFDGACAAGELAPVRAWLGEKIWRWGRAKDSGELIESACGEPFSPVYYTDYLTEKFSAIYRLGV